MADAVFPPRGACDCHAHVVGPKARYPLVTPRAYTPMDAPVEAVEAMLDRLGLDRIVLVQTSVFGTDNSCMTDAIVALKGRARGVAQVPEDVPGAELDRLHGIGVRGIRVNLNTMGMNDPEAARGRLKSTAVQCARNGWHLQLFTTPDTIEALGDELAALPVPVVLDHFGLLSPVGRTVAAERLILTLLAAGKGWVKISGTYRLDPPDDAASIAALARRLHAANPENIVWGSDWPHTPPHPASAAASDKEEPYRDLDTAALLDTVRQWFDEPRRWTEILVDNPARLYDFPA